MDKQGGNTMNGLTIFKHNNFGEVRTVIRDGEPWFVAADVCERFGVTNRNRVMQTLDDDEKGGTQMMTPGGIQNVAIVSEAGLYSLLFALQPTKARGVSDEYIEARCAELKAFKRWITHEVIPAVRKHGMYAVDQLLENPDIAIAAFTQLKEERARRKALEAQAAVDSPKVLFADSVAASKQSILVGELAKLLKQNGVEVGQNRLFEQLRDEGFLCKCGDQYNMPTQRSMELGIMEIKERTINCPDGSVRLTRTPVVTGKGQIYFVNKLRRAAQHDLFGWPT